MNKIIVGMGEALWDCLPRRKEDRRCSGKLCLPCIAVWFRQPCGQCRRCRCGWGRDSGCVRPEGAAHPDRARALPHGNGAGDARCRGRAVL